MATHLKHHIDYFKTISKESWDLYYYLKDLLKNYNVTRQGCELTAYDAVKLAYEDGVDLRMVEGRARTINDYGFWANNELRFGGRRVYHWWIADEKGTYADIHFPKQYRDMHPTLGKDDNIRWMATDFRRKRYWTLEQYENHPSNKLLWLEKVKLNGQIDCCTGEYL